MTNLLPNQEAVTWTREDLRKSPGPIPFVYAHYINKLTKKVRIKREEKKIYTIVNL